jgi:hypothetical protein
MFQQIEREEDREIRLQLASELVGVAEKMNEPRASQLLDRTGDRLVTALEKDLRSGATDGENFAMGGSGLPTRAIILGLLADEMAKPDAARLCGRAARAIAAAGEFEKWAGRLTEIEFLASRMGPTEGDALCRGAIRSVLTKLRSLDMSIGPLLSQLEPVAAMRLGGELASWACAQGDIDNENLDAILTERGRLIPVTRGPHGITFGEDAQSQSAPRKPLPCRLTTQAHVELLKMPTCFGAARQVVLNHLGNRYGRRFVNHWEFVRYAREQHLDLNLTTPPKRPDPKESVKRMLEILDGPAAR